HRTRRHRLPRAHRRRRPGRGPLQHAGARPAPRPVPGRPGRGAGGHRRPLPGPGGPRRHLLDDRLLLGRPHPRAGLRALPQPAQRRPVPRPARRRPRLLPGPARRHPPQHRRPARPRRLRRPVRPRRTVAPDRLTRPPPSTGPLRGAPSSARRRPHPPRTAPAGPPTAKRAPGPRPHPPRRPNPAHAGERWKARPRASPFPAGARAADRHRRGKKTGAAPAPPASLPAVHHDTAPAATGSLPLPDGRTLAYAEYGDPDGAPVLFVPGAASGRRMSFGGPLPHRRRIRLISIDRPGLGASTPDPEKTLRSVGADLTRLAH